MTANEIDDETLAGRVASDRTTISRIRRFKQRPLWDLGLKLVKECKGVTLEELVTFPVAETKKSRRRAA